MQVSGWEGAKLLHADHGQAIRYTGMADCFVRTVKEEGFSALFKGILPNYVKVIPSIAIAFVVYEHVSEALHVELEIPTS
jgi:solute carrier family 25 phosphate transporter 23/24/25/41